MSEKKCAIKINNVTKTYKLFKRNRDRVMDAFGIGGKRYREHNALKNLSFDVNQGETVGIIGTNGAGKSTILKIITGVLNPTDGDVEVNGRISALLELGAGFNQEYTGVENVYLNGTMMGYTKEEVDAKLDAILEFADIGDFVYQPVKTYSSGMFVRLAFAVAINIDPEILVVDEALSVGDVFFQNKCYQKFEDFKKEGKTILFVSHDLSSISKYCDRVILLNHGEKMAEGSSKDMVNLYKKLIAGTSRDVKKAMNKEISRDENNEFSVWYKSTDEKYDKSQMTLNTKMDEYGSHKAVIRDFAIIDDDGQITDTIIKGSKFTLKTEVYFYEDVENPIFTYTFKNVKGVEVTGTNTMFEDKLVDKAKAGETYVVTYEQNMDLQGAEYLLSMSCTTFQKGEIKALHRCYDLTSVTVISDKNTVGFYDMNSKITVTKKD